MLKQPFILVAVTSTLIIKYQFSAHCDCPHMHLHTKDPWLYFHRWETSLEITPHHSPPEDNYQPTEAQARVMLPRQEVLLLFIETWNSISGLLLLGGFNKQTNQSKENKRKQKQNINKYPLLTQIPILIYLLVERRSSDETERTLSGGMSL